MTRLPNILESLPPQLFRSEPDPVGGDVVATLASGRTLKMGDEERAELLLRVRSGEQIEMDLDFVAFRQEPGVPNRNFVRFKPSILSKLAKSFVSVPLLKDHDQGSIESRGGTITKSKAIKENGDVRFEMTARLTAPWAVEALLTGNLDRFSIGWDFPGLDALECSICKTQIFTDCFHFPGDLLENEDTEPQRVEFIYTSATGTEVSGVSVPAVLGTGVDAIRQTLSSFAGKLQAQSGRLTGKDLHMDKIAKALGLDSGAEVATVLATIAARSEASAATHRALTDERTAHAETAAKLAAAEAAAEASEATARIAQVDRLVSENEARLNACAPEMIESIRTLASKDIDAARSILASLPAPNVAATAQSLRPPPIVEANGSQLSAEEESVRVQLGISLEDWHKHRPASN